MYQTQTLPPIDRLFLRMASNYGKHWFDMWGDTPIEAMKQEWQEGLTGFTLGVVFKAVDYCRDKPIDYPPTLPMFRAICKSLQPKQEFAKLERKFTKEEIEKNKGRMKDILAGLSKNKEISQA